MSYGGGVCTDDRLELDPGRARAMLVVDITGVSGGGMCGLRLRMVGLGRPMDAGKPARGDSSGGGFSASALEKGWLSGNLSIASILFLLLKHFFQSSA